MFGIGMQELLLILVIALIILGPKKLPEVAKALGKAMNEFKRATNDIKESLEVDHSLNSIKKSYDTMNDTQPAAGGNTSASVSAPSDVKAASPSHEEAAPKANDPPHVSS